MELNTNIRASPPAQTHPKTTPHPAHETTSAGYKGGLCTQLSWESGKPEAAKGEKTAMQYRYADMYEASGQRLFKTLMTGFAVFISYRKRRNHTHTFIALPN